MNEHERLPLGNFDRDYDLTELLPVDFAGELLCGFEGILDLTILLPCGTIYYSSGDALQQVVESIPPALDVDAQGPVEIMTAQGLGVVFILIHELEVIGYLVIVAKKMINSDLLTTMGNFIAKAINQAILMNYKYHLTAGLHGQVVEASYEELKAKNISLQQSEEKYRLLSQNLQIEVARKTERIKTAQLAMMQQEKLAAIGHLAAGMAHEINNPIGFILSNLNTLHGISDEIMQLLESLLQLEACLFDDQADSGPSAECRKALGHLKKLCKDIDIAFLRDDMPAIISESVEGATRIKTIVQNLKEFARPGVSTTENADINRCLDNTLSLFSELMGEKVHIKKKYGQIPMVSCRLREINQIFFHIIRNALQAVAEGGNVLISTQPLDDHIQIEITDTGPGIAQQHLPHIFEPFFTTREVGAGTGLGLNLTYNLLKKNGGAINVNSESNQGTTFTILLPINVPKDESCG